uniref:Putative ovule protein n=1 Tax=Solanum chacoense TaxID=4108 RepID=A0A0V0HXF9_SOLCH
MMNFSRITACLSKYFTNGITVTENSRILIVVRCRNEQLKSCVSNLLICSSVFVYLNSRALDSLYPSMTKVSRSDELCRKLQIPGKSNCLKVVLSCKNFQLDGGGCHPSNSSMDRYWMHQGPNSSFSTWATL